VVIANADGAPNAGNCAGSPGDRAVAEVRLEIDFA
jgi:hypothetical protein